MMDAREISIITLLSLLLFTSPSLSQTPDECEGSGRYCFANTLYDCVDGEPQVVEYCPHRCESGQCIDSKPIAPSIHYQEPEDEVSGGGDDTLLYLVLGVVILVIVALFARMALRK